VARYLVLKNRPPKLKITPFFINTTLICLTLYVLFLSDGANANQGQLELNTGWKMNTGDNPDWAKPDFDDSVWDPIKVGEYWEKNGYPDYDGYAWYRTTIDISKNWKETTEHGFLVLSLGYIDDADVTYFNGTQIGSTGKMPPNFSRAYGVQRFYRIPVNLVQWDKPNVIAVQVYDGSRGGGFYKRPYYIKTPEIDETLEMTVDIPYSDGIYFSPNPLPVSVNIQNYSINDYQMSVVCTLKSDRVDKEIVFATKQANVIVNGKSDLTKTFEFIPPGPGFYRVVTKLAHNKKTIVQKSIMLGYGPEKIKTELTQKKGFEDFWEKRKQDLANVNPEFKVTKSDRSTKDLDVFLVEMRSYGNVRIKGWYTVPRKTGPHAAILSVPGYNSTMWPNLKRTNVATIALNPRGHGNSKEDIVPKGAEYMYLGFDTNAPEKYIYVGAYMDCVRAIDFLVSRPEIDNSLIGVEGGSQGGGLSFATAALDQRIKFCAADIPWLGDWIGYLETADWPHENYPKLVKQFPGLSFDEINRVLSYIDTMNLAPWIKCPVLMSVGLQDAVCPPRNSFATYNQVQSAKEYRVYPFAGHNVWYNHSEYKNRWMAKILGVEKSGL
jgi:cephalosporin-C deacetylase